MTVITNIEDLRILAQKRKKLRLQRDEIAAAAGLRPDKG